MQLLSAPLRPRRPVAFGLVLTPLVCGAIGTAHAQTTTPIPLDYNFNGIVHVGEELDPDDPDGFRSISDRALNFTAGVPSDELLDQYQLVAVPGVLDLVHLGNRDKVAGGGNAFDATADGDARGIQPNWLSDVDQSGPQTSLFATPLDIPVNQSTNASFLFHFSNGGGIFEIQFDFASGQSFVVPATAPDWFGGDYAGTGSIDQALPDGNLNVQEVNVDLTQFAGDQLVSVTFQNSDNSNGGIAVFAGNLVSAATASNTYRNDGTNPSSYLAVGLPVLGQTYTATVLLEATTGHDVALVVGFQTPANILLPTGQTILVNPFDPAGELLGLSIAGGSTATFNVPIPSDPSFAGFTLSTQAIHAGGAPGFALSNAYDHVVGI